MKLKIMSQAKVETGSKDLPIQFNETIREDIVKRAVHALQTNRRVPYGVYERAGMGYSKRVSKRRRDYRGCYGQGVSRTPKKIMMRRGTRIHWVGAFAPMTVGGRTAHPPKKEKIWLKKINSKENRKAIRSAMAATVNKEVVIKRGHKIPTEYPFLLETKFESLKKTNDVIKALTALGFDKELERTKVKKIRAGKGTMRGRKYKRKIGPLIVVSQPCELSKSARNIPGVNVISVKRLTAEHLAPGTHIGRATLFTEAALEKISKENLFI